MDPESGPYMAATETRKPSGLLERLLDQFTRWRQPPAQPTTVAAREDRPLAVAPEVRASAHLDGLVLLHIPSGRVFLCNRTGARIWKGLSSGLNSDAIAKEISREYGVALDLVVRHTSRFLLDLEQHGFVKRLAGVE